MSNDEIVTALRYCQIAAHSDCWGCPANIVDASCLDRLHAAAADALEAQQKRIEKLEQERRWIPVTERLPKSGVRVIVCRGDKVEQGVFLGVNGWWKVYGTNTKKVTHWMPLPQPPKGE